MKKLVAIYVLALLLQSAIALKATSAQAGAFDPGFGPGGKDETSIEYSGMYYPNVDAKNAVNRIGIHREHMEIAVPVYKNAGHRLSISASADLLDIRFNAPPLLAPPIPAPPPVPDELYDLGFELRYSHTDANKTTWGLTLGAGSASDKPFSELDVTTFEATALYGFRGEEHGYWILFLNYSNNRPILNHVPLPGFAYIYAPTKSFIGTFGIPFVNVKWLPHPRFKTEFLVVVPWTAKAKVSVAVAEPLWLFVAYDFEQEAYLRKNRAMKDHRYFYDEMKASGGLTLTLNDTFVVELAGGYAFNRRLFEAEDYSDRDKVPYTPVGNGWFGALEVAASF